jgi:adenylylsulfate kinase-like enzyme
MFVGVGSSNAYLNKPKRNHQPLSIWLTKLSRGRARGKAICQEVMMKEKTHSITLTGIYLLDKLNKRLSYKQADVPDKVSMCRSLLIDKFC